MGRGVTVINKHQLLRRVRQQLGGRGVTVINKHQLLRRVRQQLGGRGVTVILLVRSTALTQFLLQLYNKEMLVLEMKVTVKEQNIWYGAIRLRIYENSWTHLAASFIAEILAF